MWGYTTILSVKLRLSRRIKNLILWVPNLDSTNSWQKTLNWELASKRWFFSTPILWQRNDDRIYHHDYSNRCQDKDLFTHVTSCGSNKIAILYRRKPHTGSGGDSDKSSSLSNYLLLSISASFEWQLQSYSSGRGIWDSSALRSLLLSSYLFNLLLSIPLKWLFRQLTGSTKFQ